VDNTTLDVWEVAAGRRVVTRTMPFSWSVRAASFRSDGSGAIVLCGKPGAAAVVRMDFRSGEWRELFALPFPVGEYLTASPDGKIALVAGNGGTLVGVDLLAGKELWRIEKASEIFALSPDSQTFVVRP